MDGCRGGWFAVEIGTEKHWRFGLYASIPELAEDHPHAEVILIDMPIGLPAVKGRSCDQEARRLLGARRASSIFPVPCRAALAARTYAEACAVNAEILGVKLSKQTFGILPKIRELDDWLQATGDRHWRESHPELALRALNGGAAIEHRKKTKEGLAERLRLLGKIFPPSSSLFAVARMAHSKKQLADDDIVDAITLAVTGWLSGSELKRVPQAPETDATGLPMEIVFAPHAISKPSKLAQG